MGKFACTWQLMGASWRMLMQDKRLIVFPLVSGVALAIVLVLFAAPVIVTAGGLPADDMFDHLSPRGYLALFVFYFIAYFVMFFFNAALVACVLRQVDGEAPSVSFGLAVAWQRLPAIIGWAFASSTVGILLRMLQDKAGWLGRLFAGGLGVAWSVTAFLVVPVLVAEDRGPVESYRRSASLLRRTWGEQIIGNLGLGLISGVLGLGALVLLFVVGFAAGPTVFLVLVPLVVVWEAALILVQSALQSIYQTALYLYASGGGEAPGFDQQLLAAAFKPKQAGA